MLVSMVRCALESTDTLALTVADDMAQIATTGGCAVCKHICSPKIYRSPSPAFANCNFDPLLLAAFVKMFRSRKYYVNRPVIVKAVESESGL